MSSVPPSMGANRYVQRVCSLPGFPVSNVNSLPGSATLTVGVVDHRISQFSLL